MAPARRRQTRRTRKRAPPLNPRRALTLGWTPIQRRHANNRTHVALRSPALRTLNLLALNLLALNLRTLNPRTLNLRTRRTLLRPPNGAAPWPIGWSKACAR